MTRPGVTQGWREVWLAVLLVSGAAQADTWALEHVRIVPSASAEAIEDGTVVVKDGRVAALGASRSVRIPVAARRVSGAGHTVLPGYWNVHVHFTGDRFAGAAGRAAAELSQACRDMLTSRGFTTVVDLGSSPQNTVALRSRASTLDCPRILTTGASIFPVDQVPIYVRQALGDAEASKLPQPRTAEAAAGIVRYNVGLGAVAIKLFTGTWLGGGRTGLMDVAVVRGATAAAHRAKLLVFSHPQSADGLKAAIDGGVDILAHTAPDAGPWTPAFVERLKERNIGLAPTLSLWRVEMDRAGLPPNIRTQFIDGGAAQLRAFASGGGEVLFGTDVGYIPEKDADEEVGRMAAAGMDWKALLTSLTAAPARRFRDGGRGSLAVGSPADLVLLDGDPRSDVAALTRVTGTWVAGRSVFAR
jgi:imidazolonepropionase-like amidohydrolase